MKENILVFLDVIESEEKYRLGQETWQEGMQEKHNKNNIRIQSQRKENKKKTNKKISKKQIKLN